MLLQTNSYIVPKDKRAQHARLVQRFRHTLMRLGCAHFEAYEQVGANWSPADTTGRFVQLMRFKDRKQQLAVQSAERNDATAQALIKEFCELINFPYQQQQGLFAVGFYHSLLPTQTTRTASPADVDEAAESSIANGATNSDATTTDAMNGGDSAEFEEMLAETSRDDLLSDDELSDEEKLSGDDEAEIELNEEPRR